MNPIHRVLVHTRVYVVFEIPVLHPKRELHRARVQHEFLWIIDLSLLEDHRRTLSQKHFLNDEEQTQEDHRDNRDRENRPEPRVMSRTPCEAKQDLTPEYIDFFHPTSFRKSVK